LAAEDGYTPAGYVGGISEIPNGYGGSAEREERAAPESENVHKGLY
jgi:hypothetical protein